MLGRAEKSTMVRMMFMLPLGNQLVPAAHLVALCPGPRFAEGVLIHRPGEAETKVAT